jgi:hypothetical protein
MLRPRGLSTASLAPREIPGSEFLVSRNDSCHLCVFSLEMATTRKRVWSFRRLSKRWYTLDSSPHRVSGAVKRRREGGGGGSREEDGVRT